MRITRIVRHPRRDRARIHVDGEEQPRLELAVDLLLRAGLATGDVLRPRDIAQLEREDEGIRARDAALRLLSHRSRSAAELRRRLEDRQVKPAVVGQTLEWLEERGFVDDRAFAESFVRDRLRLRPRGRARLVQELRRKGVDPGVAARAADEVMAIEEMDEPGLAREAARAWARRNGALLDRAHRSEDRQRARRRLYGHLARRGFRHDAIGAGIAAVLGD